MSVIFIFFLKATSWSLQLVAARQFISGKSGNKVTENKSSFTLSKTCDLKPVYLYNIFNNCFMSKYRNKPRENKEIVHDVKDSHVTFASN